MSNNRITGRYYTEINEEIMRYLRDNAIDRPFIEYIDIDCPPSLYDITEVKNMLSSDLIFWIQEKIQDDISSLAKKYDKFLISIDIFSRGAYPNKPVGLGDNEQFTATEVEWEYSAEFDCSGKRVQIYNNILFPLASKNLDYYIYNYNGYSYIFFNSSTDTYGMFDDSKGPIEVKVISHENNVMINIDAVDYDDRIIPKTNDIDTLTIAVSIDNKIVDVRDPIEKIFITVFSPYMTFDYEPKKPDSEDFNNNLRGLGYFTKDAFVSIANRGRGVDVSKNLYSFHDRLIILTSSGLLISNDKSYDFLDLVKNDSKVKRIDKHTFTVDKELSDKLSKVIIWLKAKYTGEPAYGNVDNLYDEVMEVDPAGYLDMAAYQRDTSNMYNLFQTSYSKSSLDEIIALAYKYDLDILKVIQRVFNPIVKVFRSDIKVVMEYKDIKFIQPRILINVTNKCMFTPHIFYNGRLLIHDYFTKNYESSSVIILDPKIFGYNIDLVYQRFDIKDIEKAIDKDFKFMTVVMSPERLISNEDINSTMAGKMITEPYIHKHICHINSDYNHNIFVNGFLTNNNYNDSLTDNKYKELLCRLRPVVPFDSGDNSLIDDSIFIKNRTLSTCINTDINQINTIEYINISPMESHSPEDIKKEKIIRYKNSARHSECTVLAFNEYGEFMHENVTPISSEYCSVRDYVRVEDSINEKNNLLTGGTSITLLFIPLFSYDKAINLEIDYSKVESFNVGSFNDRVIENDYIKDILRRDYDFTKSLDNSVYNKVETSTLEDNKLLTRYWFSCLGNPFDTKTFSDEVTLIGNSIINPDGSYGVIPPTSEYFMQGSINEIPLMTELISSNLIYNELLSKVTTSDKIHALPNLETFNFNFFLHGNSTSKFLMSEVEKHYTIEYPGLECIIAHSYIGTNRDFSL